MTSSWLAFRGKAKETPDISEWNYPVGDKATEPDLVKGINEEIDKTQQSNDAQTRNLISYYNAAARSKSQQFQALANITKSGVELAKWWKEYEETAAITNEYTNSVLSDPNNEYDDPDIKKLNEVEQKKTQNEIEIAKQTQLIFDGKISTQDAEIKELLEVDDFKINDSKRRLTLYRLKNLLIEDQALLQDHAIILPDSIARDLGLEPGSKMSYNDAVMAGHREAADWLESQIDRLLVHHAREIGMSKGELKKYVIKPLLDQSLLRGIGREQAFNDANRMKVADAEATNFAAKINLAAGVTIDNNGNVISVTGFDFGDDVTSEAEENNPVKIFLDTLNIHKAGSKRWDRALDNTFNTIQRGIDNDDLNFATIDNLGDMPLTINGVTKKLRDHWPKRFAELERAAVTKEKTRLEGLLQDQENKKNQFLLQQRKDIADGKIKTFADAQQQINSWLEDPILGGMPIPQEVLNAGYKFQKNEQDLVWLFEKKIQNYQALTNDEFQLLSNPENIKKFKPYVNNIVFSPDAERRRVASLTALESRYLFGTGTILQNDTTGQLAYYREGMTSTYIKAFSEYMSKFPLDRYPESLLNADKVAAEAVENALAKSIGIIDSGNNIIKPGDGNMGGPSATADLLLNDVNNIERRYKAGTLTIHSPEPWQLNEGRTEESQLKDVVKNYVIPYINGQDVTVPSGLYEVLARTKVFGNVNAHNLIIARAEHVGLLPEGVNAEDLYVNHPVELQGKVGNGAVCRTLFAKQRDLTEVMTIMAKPGFNYSTITDKNGNIIDKNVQEMNMEDLIKHAKANPEHKIGIYGLTWNELQPALRTLNESQQYLRSLGDEPPLFDENFQNVLLFAHVRGKAKKDHQYSGGNIDWQDKFDNISVEDAKEFEDIQNTLYGDTDFTYLKLSTLIPACQSVVIDQTLQLTK